MNRPTKMLMSQCYSVGVYQIPHHEELARKGQHSGVITKRNNAAFLYVQPVNYTQVKIRVVDGDNSYEQALKFSLFRSGYGIVRLLVCSCGQRVRTLYLRNGYFACRHCHNLTYECKRYEPSNINYKLDRYEKISALKAQIKIPVTKKGYTKKAKKVLKMLSRVRGQ